MGYIKLLIELAMLKHNVNVSRKKMQKIQRKKFCKLIRFAWKHSPYYRKVFEQAGIKENQLNNLPPSAFPSIDKKTLMQNFDSILTVSGITQEQIRKFDYETELSNGNTIPGKSQNSTFHIVHSSGSTGIPCYFLYDKKAWHTMLLGIIRGALWDMNIFQIIRLLIGHPKVMYIAATDGRYGGAMAVGDGITGVGAEQLYLDIKKPLSQWVDTVNNFNPDIIIGYPSAIKILGELIKQNKVSVKIQRLVSCGEPLPQTLRLFLEETFSAPVINIYGASESLAMGIELGSKEGMMLFDDLNLIEETEDGIYLTSLYNFAQPLIRYKLSDRLKIKDVQTIPFSCAENLLGRNEDLLWFEDNLGNKDFLHPLAVEGFCIKGLKDYQFLQTGKDSFKMIAEISDEIEKNNIEKELNKYLWTILQEKNLQFVKYSISFISEILPDDKTGKKPLIVASTVKEDVIQETAI